MKRVAEEENVSSSFYRHAWYYHKNGVEVLSELKSRKFDRVSSRRHVRFDSDDRRGYGSTNA